jgi:hypothetical protein
LGHKLYMDNFFSSTDLSDNLSTKAINCCGTVRPHQRGMPSDFGKKIKGKWGDQKSRVTGVTWQSSMERQIKCKYSDKYSFSSSRR